MELLHQRREHIRDILQCFRAIFQRVEELVVRVPDLLRRNGAQHSLEHTGDLGLVAAVMRCAEEDDRVCGDEDRVQMRDVLRGSAGGICQCLKAHVSM